MAGITYMLVPIISGFLFIPFRRQPKITTAIALASTLFMCLLVSYYFSKSVDIFSENHPKERLSALLFVSALLLFEMTQPAKYAPSSKRNAIHLIGVTAFGFFILIRFYPIVGEILFGWLPVFVWT